MAILAVVGVLLVLLVAGVMILSGNDIARYRRLKRM
jgi:hypothetical protein